MKEHILDLQRRVTDAGHPAGPLDGILGPQTAGGFQSWLQDEGFDFNVSVERGELVLRGPRPSAALKSDHPLPWMVHAFDALGLHETRDNADLAAFLRSDGSALGDPARFPWCGDFVQTCLRLGLPGEQFRGRVRENPYLARNWLEFGTECGPSVGAVTVFHRGDPRSIYGHVAFYLGEDDDHIYVIGGNQSNAVTTAKMSKSRHLGYRWPFTSPFKPAGERRISADLALSMNEA